MAAQQSTILRQHRSSLFLLAACIAVLGLMFLLTVAKDLRTRGALEAQLADETRRAESRKLLAPLLAELRRESEASLPAAANEGGEALASGSMSADNYQRIIGEIVRQCGLEQASLAPDLQSLLSDTGSLRVELAVRGAFPDFRRLILALARLPFLSGIETFRIEASEATGMLELLLQLRLQLQEPSEGGHEHQ